MAMLKEYFKLNKQYREKYGEKTILLFQVGAFYEVYTEVNAKTKEIVEEQVIEFKRFTELASANKNETTLMLDFVTTLLINTLRKYKTMVTLL